ncbi:AI-2E family transporter [Caproiciproducens sp. NJN-50]|uniref:AI-2E family transporter n=1 Tax=Acutalibacteraceae TaxID=3082771 RepID=UPI000FFE01B4|nr:MULTISPECIES: AI-2E family transporter [Acutalibacteraceae]QAT50557.1 AI-2E family transporter [Caproiciproducens sp. NJN-50]
MELNRKNMKMLALLIAFGIVFYMALQNLYRIPDLLGILGGVFAPILLGLVFAFILNIVMLPIETKLFSGLNRKPLKIWPKIRRPVSILTSLLIVIGLIALILLIVVPELVRTITSLTNQTPSFFNGLQKSLAQIASEYPAIGEYLRSIKIDWASASQMIAANGQKLAGTLVGSTVMVTANVFHAALTLVLSFVIALNILIQKEKLRRQAIRVFQAYLPNKFHVPFLRLCSLVYTAFSNFIVGQCTEACILGTLCLIGMSLFRFPYALLVSVLVAFMALIPIIGAFLSTVIGALLILIVSPIQAIWFVVFFVILQQLEGNLIFPHVVGSRVGLPALWVLVAVTIGGNLFGVAGMLVSIPVCSVLYTLLREDVSKRLKKRRCPAEQQTSE